MAKYRKGHRENCNLITNSNSCAEVGSIIKKIKLNTLELPQNYGKKYVLIS